MSMLILIIDVDISVNINHSEGFPRTGYLVPVRDALWDLPGWKSCWRLVVVAAAVAVAAVGVILKIQVDILARVL